MNMGSHRPKDLQSGLYGYYNQDGYWEIPPQYETTYSFEGDYAFFREDGKRRNNGSQWGYHSST